MPPTPSFVWQRLRDSGVDYGMILKERREWLLSQDLARNEALLTEWFTLIKELDLVARAALGVDDTGMKMIDGGDGRARSHSFTSGDKGRTSPSPEFEGGRPRSQSFLEFMMGKVEEENKIASPIRPGTNFEAPGTSSNDLSSEIMENDTNSNQSSPVQGDVTPQASASPASEISDVSPIVTPSSSGKKKKFSFRKKKRVVKDGDKDEKKKTQKKTKKPKDALRQIFQSPSKDNGVATKEGPQVVTYHHSPTTVGGTQEPQATTPQPEASEEEDKKSWL
eukprot:m.22073 g.22073  ORF g.22073 m.22073 type:complete len:279 (+) comp7335_c0_seq1:194-1030(+)